MQAEGGVGSMQGAQSGTRSPVSRIRSHFGVPAWSLLLPLPASLPLSLCVSLMDK